METSVAKANRLLASLEELVGQEVMYLRGGYYDVAATVRQRSEPLVQLLVDLSRQPGVSQLQPRVTALVERCGSQAAFLRGKMVELGEEIQRTDRARFRTTRVAPAYAQVTGAAAPRFVAAG